MKSFKEYIDAKKDELPELETILDKNQRKMKKRLFQS